MLTISYGDYNSPTFIFKEEQALITSVKQNVSMQDSTITYTISAVSAVKLATAGIYSFVKRRAKPSTVLKELLRDNKKYGLKDIFYGMRNDTQVDFAGLIATDDKVVDLKAKVNVSIFEYMNYLVSCMTCVSDGDGISGRHKYLLQVYDDTTGELAGPYFKVIKVANSIQEQTSIDTYELDIGFPAVDMVVDFQVTTDEGYTILYNYNEKQTQGTRVYNINNKGEYDYVVTNPVLKSKTDFSPSDSEKAWWAQVTQYPLQATVTLKGLLRPAMLMSYVKVNCLFYGRKSNLSGTYIITKQVDRISGDGYKTTLNLVRIMGDTLQ